MVVLVPWVLDLCFPQWKVTTYAPGAAIVLGILYTVWLGSPMAAFMKKAVSWLLGSIIVAMGCTMNLYDVASLGARGLLYTAVGISSTIALGIFLGRRLKIEEHTTLLTSIGTAICGGSAIAAAAPVLKARSHEIAFATATVFILNAIALVIFPILGHCFGFSQEQFGTWAALAVHDTSSVVGTTMAYGDQAWGVGVTLKLLRALWIVPVTLVLSFWLGARMAKQGGGERATVRARVPWFIPGFIIAATVVTYVPEITPEHVGDAIVGAGKVVKHISKYILILALFWVGAGISIEKMKAVGIRPFVHGAILWAVVATAWCLAIKFVL